jgi:hypothetical protein
MKRRTGGRDSPAAASSGVAELASACRSHAAKKSNARLHVAGRKQPFSHWHSTMIIKLLWECSLVCVDCGASGERASNTESFGVRSGTAEALSTRSQHAFSERASNVVGDVSWCPSRRRVHFDPEALTSWPPAHRRERELFLMSESDKKWRLIATPPLE